MKSIFALLIAILTALSPVAGREPKPDEFPNQTEFTAEFKRDFPGCEYIVIPAQELSGAVLTGRTGWNEHLVCITTGTVLNALGDGREDLPEPYNYISYRDVPFETNPGDRIVTYLVYEIHSDGEDDIVARYDYPLTFPGQPLN